MYLKLTRATDYHLTVFHSDNAQGQNTVQEAVQ